MDVKAIETRPGRARTLYYRNSRKAAVTEKCIECANGLIEAKRCTIQDCALWPFRPGTPSTGREVPDHVPSLAELDERIAADLRGRAERVVEDATEG